MLYAKHAFRASPRRFAQDLADLALAAAPDVETARQMLVMTGQLEQAVLDSHGDAAELATRATATAARLLLSASRGDHARAVGIGRLLSRQLREAAQHLGPGDIEVRIPEGYAWYALYPESYARTAERWAHKNGAGLRSGSVLVVGLRSIGTSLAALVGEVLRQRGLHVETTTIRTGGDPFARSADLPVAIRPAARQIVVDEGPGLSGSTMAAAAEALELAGAPSGSIDFFAGHQNGPGRHAAPERQRWWSSDRVWTTDLADTPSGDALLLTRLEHASERWLGEPIVSLRRFGTQDWLARSGLACAPRASAPALESPKLLAIGQTGRAIVLKFAGLCATDATLSSTSEAVQRRLERLARSGLTPRASGSAQGWVAIPWIEGLRLSPVNASPAFVEQHLARYVASAASDPIRSEVIESGIARIAAAAKAWAADRRCAHLAATIERARDYVLRAETSRLAAGDGRLAPHEWIATHDGRVLKLDAGGHAIDHTWVGLQPVEWDIAGAEIEWELDSARARLLRHAIAGACGASLDPAVLAFYRLGYCAFRVAAARHCAAVCAEGEQFLEAASWYERHLTASLRQLEQELACPTR